MRFADSVIRGSRDDLEQARDEVARTLGGSALIDAAAVVAIFSCNVRVADASGVPLDESSAEVRERIGARVGVARFEEPAARGEPA